MIVLAFLMPVIAKMASEASRPSDRVHEEWRGEDGDTEEGTNPLKSQLHSRA